MGGIAVIFFVVFALVLAVMYLAIRREWFAPGLTAGVGVLVSITIMVLTSLAQGNSPLQALVVGILLGGLFSGATLAVAWYFHRSEMQARYMAEQGYEQGYYQPNEQHYQQEETEYSNEEH